MVKVIIDKLCSKETQEKIIEAWKVVEPYASRMVETLFYTWADFISLIVSIVAIHGPKMFQAYKSKGLDGLYEAFAECVIAVIESVVKRAFSKLQGNLSAASGAVLALQKTKLLKRLRGSLLPILKKTTANIQA